MPAADSALRDSSRIRQILNYCAQIRESHTSIPWSIIARTRDIYAHHYGAIDLEMVWETAVNDIPEIEQFCKQYIAE